MGHDEFPEPFRPGRTISKRGNRRMFGGSIENEIRNREMKK
jgi:hypothetical protein